MAVQEFFKWGCELEKYNVEAGYKEAVLVCAPRVLASLATTVMVFSALFFAGTKNLQAFQVAKYCGIISASTTALGIGTNSVTAQRRASKENSFLKIFFQEGLTTLTWGIGGAVPFIYNYTRPEKKDDEVISEEY